MNRRVAALLCAALMIMLLYGCGSDDAVPDGQTTPEPLTTPEATFNEAALPEPTPTPVVLLSADAMIFALVRNEDMGVSFYCPSHWIGKPARSTLQFEEPTPGDTFASRIAITHMSVSKRPDVKAMQSEVARFLKLLEREYDSVTAGEVREKVPAMGTNGYRQKYAATKGDESITGYVLLCYTSADSRLYLVHFAAEESRYLEINDIWDRALASLQRL